MSSKDKMSSKDCEKARKEECEERKLKLEELDITVVWGELIAQAKKLAGAICVVENKLEKMSGDWCGKIHADAPLKDKLCDAYEEVAAVNDTVIPPTEYSRLAYRVVPTKYITEYMENLETLRLTIEELVMKHTVQNLNVENGCKVSTGDYWTDNITVYTRHPASDPAHLDSLPTLEDIAADAANGLALIGMSFDMRAAKKRKDRKSKSPTFRR